MTKKLGEKWANDEGEDGVPDKEVINTNFFRGAFFPGNF